MLRYLPQISREDPRFSDGLVDNREHPFLGFFPPGHGDEAGSEIGLPETHEGGAQTQRTHHAAH